MGERTASAGVLGGDRAGARQVRPIAFATIGAIAFAAAMIAVFGPEGPAGLTRSPSLRMLELALAACAIAGLLVLPRTQGPSGNVGRIGRYAVAGLATLVSLAFIGYAHHWADSGRLAGPLGVDLLEMLVAPLVVGAMLTIARPVDRGLGAVRIAIDGAVIASSSVVVGW